jgi:hypothetical protein
MNYKVSSLRGANMIAANPQRLVSKDGTRWACGRNVKGEGKAPRTYVPVEVWSLRCRDQYGKAVEVARHMSRTQAEEWVGRDGLTALKRWVRYGL